MVAIANMYFPPVLPPPIGGSLLVLVTFWSYLLASRYLQQLTEKRREKQKEDKMKGKEEREPERRKSKQKRSKNKRASRKEGPP